MTKPMLFYLSLTCFIVISLSGAVSPRAFADNTNLDFWWDYGETDEKNATFAPPMDREITRKTRVEVGRPEKRKVFVADEYLQIRYVILVPFDVRIDEKSLPENLGQFDISEIHFGPRLALRNERDLERQELRLIIRPEPSSPYGTYVLPSFDLHYHYDTIVGNSRIPRHEKVAVGEIHLEKVPVYARIVQQRNTGFLWDIFPCSLELHADNSVTFPGLDQQSDNDPMLQFRPGYPLMVQERKRSEFSADHYRVIRYELKIAVQDFRDQPFHLAFPKIVWQQHGIFPDGNNVVTPESAVFYIKRIADDTTGITPVKQYIAEPPGERYRVLDLPLNILWTLVGMSFLWFAFIIRQHSRQKANAGEMQQIPGQELAAYSRWSWKNIILYMQIMHARRDFHKKPDLKTCARLRELLARRVAAKLSAANRMKITEASALTAGELARLGGGKKEITELQHLQKQLESGRYDRLYDKPDGGGK